MEDCVNAVGVDLNTASVALLTCALPAESKVIAQNIVDWRDENGCFADRKQLAESRASGPKAFEQCAGFLRIAGGKMRWMPPPFTRSLSGGGKILQATTETLSDLMVTVMLCATKAQDLSLNNSVCRPFPTSLKELQNRRDPRPEFKTATFAGWY